MSTRRDPAATSCNLGVEAAIYRLIKRHGRDYWADEVIKLVIHDTPPYPDGKYLDCKATFTASVAAPLRTLDERLGVVF
jgi:hypothetical protein